MTEMSRKDLLASLSRMASDREAPFQMSHAFDQRNEAYVLRAALRHLLSAPPNKETT